VFFVVLIHIWNIYIVENTKKKNSRNSNKHTKVFLYIISAAILIIFALLGGFLLYHQGYIQDELPEALVPTAQYLWNSPDVMAKALPDYMSVNVVPPGKTRQAVEMCVSFYDEQHQPNMLLTRFTLNGVPFPSSEMRTSIQWSQQRNCISPTLKPGFHLVEIQAPPFPSYQWTIYVGD
jgi:hypothetical protein